jgi:hypothetical protein
MRSLGLLIFVSLSVAACAEDTVASSGRSSGGGGGGGTAAENCVDGVDNDQDGFVDCADQDCPQAGACQGGGDTGVQDTGSTDTGVQDTGSPDTGPEPQPENCIDGLDNDLDGRSDCADSDCDAAGACQTGPEICGNNFDDDRNGVADCADAACRGVDPCNGEDCLDGTDNDRDGLVDCDDSQCAGDTACDFTCGYRYSVCEGDNYCDDFGACQGYYFREWYVIVDSVSFSTLVDWDLLGNAPDILVEVYVDGVYAYSTRQFPDTFYAAPNQGNTFFIYPSSTVQVIAYDIDVSVNDTALTSTVTTLSVPYLLSGLSFSSTRATVNLRFAVP